MKPTSTSEKSRCSVIIMENGEWKRRSVNELSLRVDGEQPRTVRGEKLPNLIVINTGLSKEHDCVVDFFYRKLPVRTKLVTVDRPTGLNGRDALCGLAAIAVFHIVLAIIDSLGQEVSRLGW